jgi:hypothetical protein
VLVASRRSRAYGGWPRFSANPDYWIPHVRVLALVQETWTREAALAVESPEGATHNPEFTATTW